jgi:hypothetical protein
MYDRNGNTGKYCSISGKKPYNMNGNTSEYVLSTNEAVLAHITIPVVLMFCPLMEQYLLVLPFLLY